MHQVLFAKTNLMLGRMNVNVHLFRRDLEKENDNRIAPLFQNWPVTFKKSVLHHPVADVTAVDVGINIAGAGAMDGWLREQAMQTQSALGNIDRQEVAKQWSSKEVGYPLGQRPLAEGFQHRLVVVR